MPVAELQYLLQSVGGLISDLPSRRALPGCSRVSSYFGAMFGKSGSIDCVCNHGNNPYRISGFLFQCRHFVLSTKPVYASIFLSTAITTLFALSYASAAFLHPQFFSASSLLHLRPPGIAQSVLFCNYVLSLSHCGPILAPNTIYLINLLARMAYPFPPYCGSCEPCPIES